MYKILFSPAAERFFKKLKEKPLKKAYKEAIDLVLEELELYKMKGWVPVIGIAHTNIEERAADYAKILEEKTGYPVRIVDLGNVIGTTKFQDPCRQGGGTGTDSKDQFLL